MSRPASVSAILTEKQGLLQQARDCYATALGIDSSLIARSYLANALLAMKKNDDAVVQYGAILRQSPAYPGALYNLALAYYQKGDFRNALTWYMQGAKAQPCDARYRFGAGNACCKLGDLNGAIGQYTKGVELDPATADSRFLLAAALASAGRGVAALAQMREAIRLNPRNPAFAFVTGNLLKETGKPSEAAALYRQASGTKTRLCRGKGQFKNREQQPGLAPEKIKQRMTQSEGREEVTK